MLVHHHLPKTAGTTFNFGIAPQLIPPHRSLIIGTEMPVKRSSEVRAHHLRRKMFVSGHGLASPLASPSVQDLGDQAEHFFFGFARPSKSLLPSMFNQLLRGFSDSVDYDAFNFQIHRFLDHYFTSADFLLADSRRKLLRAGSVPQFYRNLQVLNDEVNLPVAFSPVRNESTVVAAALKLKNVMRIDRDRIDEIYFRAEGNSRRISISTNQFDHVVQKPRSFDSVADIRGNQEISLERKFSHILWLRGPSVLRLSVFPTARQDSGCFLNYLGTGRRRDLDHHAPRFLDRRITVPSQGMGFSLRYPFSKWRIESDRAEEVVGELLRFRIGNRPSEG